MLLLIICIMILVSGVGMIAHILWSIVKTVKEGETCNNSAFKYNSWIVFCLIFAFACLLLGAIQLSESSIKTAVICILVGFAAIFWSIVEFYSYKTEMLTENSDA